MVSKESEEIQLNKGLLFDFTTTFKQWRKNITWDVAGTTAKMHGFKQIKNLT